MQGVELLTVPIEKAAEDRAEMLEAFREGTRRQRGEYL